MMGAQRRSRCAPIISFLPAVQGLVRPARGVPHISCEIHLGGRSPPRFFEHSLSLPLTETRVQ